MEEVIEKYKRLPGRHWMVLYSSSLWLGSDHILAVYSKFFSEDYKRFYFRDIQRITVRRSNTGMIWNGIWGGLTFVAAQFLWAGWSPYPAVLSGIFLFFLLLNWLRGPKCWCHIQTAVQTEKLPALRLWRTALRALNIVRPLIEQVQGSLAIEIHEQNR